MKKERTITLAPFGGIGNRLRVIESALRMASAGGYGLRMAWCLDWGMKASYGDLLQPVEGMQVLAPRLVYDRPRKHNLWIPAPFQGMMFQKCFYEGRKHIALQELGSLSRVYITSCYAFCDEGEEDYSVFRPSDGVAARVRELTAGFVGDTVGVHVRRTDHLLAAEKSPLELFISAMGGCGCSSFYVASDSVDVKRRLAEEFPGRIITSGRTLPRGSREAEMEAMAEIFALSRCRMIIGSYDSSFGVLASRIGGTGYRCVAD